MQRSAWIRLCAAACVALTACGSGTSSAPKPKPDGRAAAARTAMQAWVRATKPADVCAQLTRQFKLALTENRPDRCPTQAVKGLGTFAGKRGDVLKVLKVARYKDQEVVTAEISEAGTRSLRVSSTYYFAPEGGRWKLNSVGQYHTAGLGPATP